MEKEGVWMALPIAIVEDQTPDAQRWRSCCNSSCPKRVHMVCLRG